jgi:hypothetical protein
MPNFFQFSILSLLLISSAQSLIKYLNESKRIIIKECYIQNKNYKLEYLYTSDDIIDLNKNQFVYERRVYTYPFNRITDFDKLKWDLIQSNYTQGAYLIRSNKYDQYLCASNKFEDIFHMRQIIYRHESIMSRKCEWFIDNVEMTSFKSVSKKIPAFYSIRNVKYNKLLYATTFFYMNINEKRSVFLWYHSNPKRLSNEFKWMIDCSKGNYIQ